MDFPPFEWESLRAAGPHAAWRILGSGGAARLWQELLRHVFDQARVERFLLRKILASRFPNGGLVSQRIKAFLLHWDTV